MLRLRFVHITSNTAMQHIVMVTPKEKIDIKYYFSIHIFKKCKWKFVSFGLLEEIYYMRFPILIHFLENLIIFYLITFNGYFFLRIEYLKANLKGTFIL